MAFLTSCLHQLVESPTFMSRVRRSKEKDAHLKSPKTPSRHSRSRSPFSPRSSSSRHEDEQEHERESAPLLSSASDYPSMQSTNTGIDTLDNTPSVLQLSLSASAVSFAKSMSDRVPPPLLVLPPHVSRAPALKISQADEVGDTGKLDFEADAFRLSEYTLNEEEAERFLAMKMPTPPFLDERSPSKTPTAYYTLSDSDSSAEDQALLTSDRGSSSPSSADSSPVPLSGQHELDKDEHEVYLENLKLLEFGGNTEAETKGLLSEETSFSLMEGTDEVPGSWESVNLLSYGWRA